MFVLWPMGPAHLARAGGRQAGGRRAHGGRRAADSFLVVLDFISLAVCLQPYSEHTFYSACSIGLSTGRRDRVPSRP